MSIEFSANAIQAATITELWCGSVGIGLACAWISYFAHRRVLLAIAFVVFAGVSCWVPPIPEELVSQIEAMFGANYRTHAAITSAVAPLLAFVGLLLGKLKEKRGPVFVFTKVK